MFHFHSQVSLLHTNNLTSPAPAKQIGTKTQWGPEDRLPPGGERRVLPEELCYEGPWPLHEREWVSN